MSEIKVGEIRGKCPVYLVDISRKLSDDIAKGNFK